MRRRYLFLFSLILLLLPLRALAATVSGSLTQISLHSTRPLEKITLTLEAEDGSRAQAATDKDGNYRFTGVKTGRYRVLAHLPSDHVPALMGADNWLLPGQTCEAMTDWFDVEGNTTVPLASTRATVFVKAIAFLDENANGGRMTSEPALRDVQVSLHPADHPEILVASGITDRKGELTLDNLSPGAYRVRVILPDNYSIGPLGSKVSIYYNCIVPSDGSEAWSDPFTLTTGSQGIGIGAVTTGSAAGTVWYDANANGRRDRDEGGLPGVAVTLTGLDSGVVRETVTDKDGRYAFTRLQPGDYSLKVTAPAGRMFAAGDSWLTADDSDTDAATLTVVAEQSLTVRDIGLMDATSLKVVFYLDANANGMQDDTETGFESAAITVTRGGKQVAAAVSDSSGAALVPIIRAGDIEISARLDETHIFSPTGLDNDFAEALATSQASAAAALTPGQQTTLYAAVTLPAQIGGQVFMDGNDDGIRGTDEGPAEGVIVEAVDWTGQVAATTVTDGSGLYLFDRLLPIPHTVRFMLNDPYIASPAPKKADGQTANSIVRQTGDYGETDLIHLAPGSYNGGVNGALFQAGTVSGRIILPEDRPAGMAEGLPGVRVTLTDLDGEPVSDYSTTLTEEDGSYYLKGILPGRYTLRYTLPDDTLFADTDELTVYSVPFDSAMGTDTGIADIVAIRTALFEGQVLCEGEPAAAILTAVNTDTGYTVTFPAETASAGHFALSRLRPGHWKITVTLEEGYSFAEDTDLVPAIAHHESSREYDLEMGEHRTGLKVLVTRPATVSGRIFLDENLDGDYTPDSESLLSDRPVRLINRDGETAAEMRTDADGRFESPKLIPGRYQVALDLDDDCILLAGYQLSETGWAQDVEALSGRNTDASVPVLRFASIAGRFWSLDDSLDFVAGLEVRLYRSDDLTAPIAVAKSNRQGEYRFQRLYPGEYQLSAVLPEGHGFARRADVSDTRTSLILSNDASRFSAVLQLVMGTHIDHADFGFGAKGAIGDFVWLDEDADGMQDIGERGIPGIHLELWQEGEKVAETDSDLYGHYLLEGIYPGHYILRVTMHPELAATRHQTEFPLIGSVLPESDGLTVDAPDVVVPSGTRNLAVDVGLRLREAGVYPAVMDTIPTTDWSFGGKKR